MPARSFADSPKAPRQCIHENRPARQRAPRLKKRTPEPSHLLGSLHQSRAFAFFLSCFFTLRIRVFRLFDAVNMPLLSGKGNKFKVDPPKIRIEKVTIERPAPPKPKPKPANRPALSSARSSPARRLSPKASAASALSSASSRAKSSSPYPSSADERRLDLQRKRKALSASQRRSPASDRVEFDKDSDAEDDGWMDLDSHKRQRKATSESKSVDSNRKLKNEKAFECKDERLQFIHAVDVASLEHKCVPIMGASKEDVAIELQYPTLQRREKSVIFHEPPTSFPLVARSATHPSPRLNASCFSHHVAMFLC